LTTRKRAGDLSLPELFRGTLAMALATAEAIASDAEADFAVAVDAVQISFPDRLALPNTAEAAEIAVKALEPVVHELFGDTARLAADDPAADPRRMLTLQVTAPDAEQAPLRAKLEQS
jgi:hypothetical protein